MGDGTSLKCPITPGRMDECPATPDRLSCANSPDPGVNATLMGSNDNNTDSTGTTPTGAATGSESIAAGGSGRQTTQSPPSNCVICLDELKDNCCTDSCEHLFCFRCLQQWSKIKAECPLCKRSFKIMIHNNEEYVVSSPIMELLPPSPPLITDFTHYVSRRNNRFHNFEISFPPRFIEHEISNATIPTHTSDNVEIPGLFFPSGTILRYITPTDAFRMEPFWRTFIYEKELYALPMVDITGRLRECSARFYRDNPAQIHRLMPWLNRELVCLLQYTEHNVSDVQNILMDLLTIYNLESREFRRRCQSYLGHRTAHFIHEFVNFARSPYDMNGYDREVRYVPQYIPFASGSSLESSESSSLVSNYEQQPQVIGQKPSHLRSPELTIVISDSDSDVVFVSEANIKPSSTLLLNSKSNSSRKCKLSMTKLQMYSTSSCLSSSDSDDYDDSDYFNPKAVRKPKTNKEEEKSQKDQIAVKNNNTNKSGETNAESSTSSEIGSFENRTNSVKKYYAKSRKKLFRKSKK